MNMTITEFCDKHNACNAGREWALRECKDMNDVWRKVKHDWLIWVATRPGVVDDETLRLFVVECCRAVQHLMTDKRSIDAVDVAYRYAIGDATDSELAAARAAAWAAREAAWAAAWDAAWAARAAARAAALDAAWAAREAAWAAAWAAAWDAAWAARAAALDAAWAAREAAWAAAWAAQDECLRAMATPNFEVTK